MLKTCQRCKTQKDVSSEFYTKARFHKYPTSLAGYDSHCKECVALDREDYLKSNPQAKAAADRKQHLKKYGLTPESYNEMFSKQKGCCAGCNRHQTEFNRNLVVDHNHETGKVRGLLCISCNLMIGYAQEETKTLYNLIEYLNEHNPELADHNSNVVELKFPKKVG